MLHDTFNHVLWNVSAGVTWFMSFTWRGVHYIKQLWWWRLRQTDSRSELRIQLRPCDWRLGSSLFRIFFFFISHFIASLTINLPRNAIYVLQLILVCQGKFPKADSVLVFRRLRSAVLFEKTFRIVIVEMQCVRFHLLFRFVLQLPTELFCDLLDWRPNFYPEICCQRFWH